MLDQILAVILLIVLISSLKRLTMGIKARLTSWGLFLIVINIFLAYRLPNAFGWKFFEDNADWERLIIYSAALVLNLVDWAIYEKETRGKELNEQQ